MRTRLWWIAALSILGLIGPIAAANAQPTLGETVPRSAPIASAQAANSLAAQPKPGPTFSRDGGSLAERLKRAATSPSPSTGRQPGSPQAAPPQAGAPVPAGLAAGGLVPLPAHRLLDTRSGLGAPKGAVAANKTVTLTVAGREGVPAGTRSVALTVTAVGPTATGYVTVHGHGTPRPTASVLNYAAGQTVPNLVVAELDAAGRVDLTVGGAGTVQLLADIAGYVGVGAPTEPTTLTSLAPSRILDTRTGNGGTPGLVTSGTTVTLQVTRRGGVPAGADTAVLNLTTTAQTGGGYVAVTPAGSSTGTSSTSSLNYAKGLTRANLVVARMNADGRLDLRVAGGSTHLIADVVGWVKGGDPTGVVGGIGALEPYRIGDTRTDGAGPVAGGEALVFGVNGSLTVPSSGVAGLLLNVTTTQATAPGYVSAFALAPTVPTGSNLNFVPGRSDANLVFVPVESTYGLGVLEVNSSGSTHVIADLVGYVLGPGVDTTAPASLTDIAVTQPTRGAVRATWTNPTDADFTGVTIRRFEGTSPDLDPRAGVLVTETTGTAFTDTGLAPGLTYTYLLWPHDDVPNFAQPEVVTVTVPPRPWTAPTTIAPFRGAPSAISCPTATWCMEGDRSGRVQRWNGTAWTSPTVVFTVPDEEAYAGITSLSCPTTSFCLAIADHEAAAYRSGAWSRVGSLPDLTDGEIWSDVECISATWCIAVGGGGRSAVWNGSTWAQRARANAPLTAIDCVSTTWCMAVGDIDTGGWASRLNGAGWTSTRVSDGRMDLVDVACRSTTFCMAVNGSRSYRWNGSAWSGEILFRDFAFYGSPRVSCGSTTSCFVFGHDAVQRWDGTRWIASRAASPGSYDYQSASCVNTTCIVVNSNGQWMRWNGSAWSTPTTFNPTYGGLVSLSCGAPRACMATDGRGSAYRWTGGGWTRSAFGASSYEIDCASATWCLATSEDGMVSRVWNNGSWATSPVRTPIGLGKPACPVAGWCVAFDQFGQMATFSGSSWSAPRTIFAGLSSRPMVDCWSKTNCLVVASSSPSLWSRWNGTSWSSQQAIWGMTSAAAVDCFSAANCVARDENTNLTWRFDGRAWRTNSTAWWTGPADDVDCPTSTVCVGADGRGLSTLTTAGWSPTIQDLGLFTNYGRATDCADIYSCVVIGGSQVTTSS